MAWQPQPGTVPHRTLAWLRENGGGKPVSTAVICDALGVDSNGFSTSMKPAVKAGMVTGQMLRGFGQTYFWTLVDDPQPQAEAVEDEPDDEKPTAFGITVRPGPLFPGVTVEDAAKKPEPQQREFRAVVFEGQLLATGMEIIDGVAVFSPEQMEHVRRVVAWARPQELAA